MDRSNVKVREPRFTISFRPVGHVSTQLSSGDGNRNTLSLSFRIIPPGSLQGHKRELEFHLLSLLPREVLHHKVYTQLSRLKFIKVELTFVTK